jgi:hypothetical protein
MTLLQKAWLRLAIKRLHRFLGIPAEEKWLLIKALILVSGVSFALKILPFWITRRLTSDILTAKNRPLFSANQLILAIETASRYVPGATCLSKALAARILLAEYGYRSNLGIGVARNNGRLKAHAWLEDGDRILIGGNLDNYKPLRMKEIKPSDKDEHTPI